VISRRTLPAGEGLFYKIKVLEGASKQDVLKALPGNVTDQDLVLEVFPTRLVEPEPGARRLARAEREAGVTWGVDAVGATHTSLTGAGVKVSCPCDMMYGPSV
jgi:hypothetical protein